MIAPHQNKQFRKKAFAVLLLIALVYFISLLNKDRVIRLTDSTDGSVSATSPSKLERTGSTTSFLSSRENKLDKTSIFATTSSSKNSFLAKKVLTSAIPSAITELNIITANRKCLQHLLDNDIVEYYYVPDNDGNSLNFTTRGTTTKQRLSNETSKPLLVVCRTPRALYDETILPRSICSSEVRLFMPNMMARDYDLARNLLKFFRHVAAVSGMEYYLNYGSLLGHIRFDKRPLPWDDDFDFSIDYSAIDRFKRIFKRERNIHIVNKNESKNFFPQLYIDDDRLKVFDETQNRTHRRPWRFPFLDLFFYSFTEADFYDMEEEKLALHSLTEAHNSDYAVNVSLSIMMPLKKETFLGVELMVPLNSKVFLNILKYDLYRCKPLSWSHRFERKRKESGYKDIDCRELQGFYDF